jgi:Rod binding domain-containing protein
MIAGLSDIPIQALASDATPAAKRAAFDRVVESFEAVFLSQMVRGLRDSLSKEFWGGEGFGKDIYASWFDEAIAESIARAGGIGLKEQLQRWVFPEDKEPSPVPEDPKAVKVLRFRGRA